MSAGWLLPLLVVMPVLLAGVSLRLRSARDVVWFCAAGTLAVAACAGGMAWLVFGGCPLFATLIWVGTHRISHFGHEFLANSLQFRLLFASDIQGLGDVRIGQSLGAFGLDLKLF